MSTPMNVADKKYILFQGHPEPRALAVLDSHVAGLKAQGFTDITVIHSGGAFNTAQRETSQHLADGLSAFVDRLKTSGVSYVRVSTANVAGCTTPIVDKTVELVSRVLDRPLTRDLGVTRRIKTTIENVHTADSYKVGKAKLLSKKDILPNLNEALGDASWCQEFETFVYRVNRAIADIREVAQDPLFAGSMGPDEVKAWEAKVCDILDTREVPFWDLLGKKAYGLFGVRKRDWDDLDAIFKKPKLRVNEFQLFLKMLNIRGTDFVTVDCLDWGASLYQPSLEVHTDEKSSLEEKIQASQQGMVAVSEGKGIHLSLLLGDGEFDDLLSALMTTGFCKCDQVIQILPLPHEKDDMRIVSYYKASLEELFASLDQPFRAIFSLEACNLRGVKFAAKKLGHC